jgi:hypothetical protein
MGKDDKATEYIMGEIVITNWAGERKHLKLQLKAIMCCPALPVSLGYYCGKFQFLPVCCNSIQNNIFIYKSTEYRL